jgi:hypothetical protein
MRTFFYMGLNTRTKSGVSWKIWKIERAGLTVTTLWGPARLAAAPVPTANLHENKRSFSSAAAAIEHETARIKNKLTKGYERCPR